MGEEALIGAILGGGVGAMAPTRRGATSEPPEDRSAAPAGPDVQPDAPTQPEPAAPPIDGNRPLPPDRPDAEAQTPSQPPEQPRPATPETPPIAPPAPERPSPTPEAPRPTSDAMDTEGGRYEFRPEMTYKNGQQVETGRMIRWDMETGEPTIVEPPAAPQREAVTADTDTQPGQATARAEDEQRSAKADSADADAGGAGADVGSGASPAQAPQSTAPVADQQSPQSEPQASPEPAAGQIRRAPAPENAQDVAVTPKGREVPVEYAVVEADDLVPSNVDDGRVNPAFPADLQPRDRTRPASQQQVRDIGRNIDPRLLGRSASSTDGAPIIAPDGVVESGNGRVMGIRQAYQNNPEGATRYRDALAQQGYAVDQFTNPVLVRVRQGEMTSQERAEFARESNERTTSSMSATERAMTDAQTMPDSILPLYRGGDLDSVQNRDFVRQFISGVVSDADAAQMIDSSGQMSQEAVRRVQGALLAKAYGNADLVGALVESSDNNIKAIGGALTDVAAQWAQMRAEARGGQIAANMDQTDALLEAVQIVNRARTSGRNVAEFVGQGDLLTGSDSISKMGKQFLALFFRNHDNWTRPYGRDKITDALQFYVEQAQKTSPGVDMLGASADPEAVIKTAQERQRGEQGQQDNLFGAAPGSTGERPRPGGAGQGSDGRRADAETPAGSQDAQGSPSDQGRQEGVTPDADANDQFDAAGDELFGSDEGEAGTAGTYVDRSGGSNDNAIFVSRADELPDRIPRDQIATEAKRLTLEPGRERGIEHLMLIDGDGQIVAYGSGYETGTGVPGSMFALWNDEGARLVAHHNHPSSNAFSPSDYHAMMAPGFQGVYAHGHDGTTVYAEPTDRGRAVAKSLGPALNLRLKVGWDSLWNNGQSAIGRLVSEGRYQKDSNGEHSEPGRDRSFAMMAALAEAGLIRAEVTGNANREGGDARNAYFTDPELKKLYINAVKSLKRLATDAGAENVNDRPTQSERHLGKMAAASEAGAGRRSNVEGTDSTRLPAGDRERGADNRGEESGQTQPVRDQVDADGGSQSRMTAPPARVTAPEKKADTKPVKQDRAGDKLEDFGQKLEGAAKDRWGKYRTRLEAIPDDDIAKEPLSKTFPEPDYAKLIEDGADPWVVSFVRSARDHIPNKPRRGLTVWAGQVRAMRDFARNLLDGDITKAQVEQKLDGMPRLKDAMMGTIDLYLAVGHEKSLKGMRLQEARYSFLQGQVQDPPKVVWEVQSPRKATAFSNIPAVVASGDTKAKAIEQFKKVYKTLDEKPKARGGTKFGVYKGRGTDQAFVGTKVGREVIEVEWFDSVQDARAALNDDRARIEERWKQLKDTPDVRRANNSPRVGVDHRGGVDVTPEMFADKFGFRGVQFGNWVEGKRRQEDLNEAYDSLMDLAGILNVDPLALSLNGEMGLAFGARGKGGKMPAKAHFEPDNFVINLSKKGGAGSLAHEWFHGVDNYFSRQRGRPVGFITQSGRDADGIRPKVARAFAGVKEAIEASGVPMRSRNLDRTRSKPYFDTTIEKHARAFETYVIAKLEDQNGSNDYLANIVPEEVFKAEAALRGQPEKTYPYPTAAEVPAIKSAFDNLFDTIEVRESTTEDGRLALGFAQRAPIQGATAVRPDVARAALPRLRSELDRLNLKRVGLKLDDLRKKRQGALVFDDFGLMDVLIGQSVNPDKTLYHESIHAMRRLDLFTDNEWGEMHKQAVADWIGRYDILARYPNLTREEMAEEAIAEAFADHAARREPPGNGVMRRAFNKIDRLIRAIRTAFKGLTAEDVFMRAFAGEIGARDAGSTGNMRTLGLIEQAQPAGFNEPGSWFGPVPNPPSRGKGKKEAGTYTVDAQDRVAALNAKYGPPATPKQDSMPGVFETPTRTGMTRFREIWQDRFIIMESIEQSIGKGTGAVVPEAISFRMKQTLFDGRTATRMERINDEEVRPFTDAIREATQKVGATLDDVGLYLTAKHAKERNAVMAKRNAEKFGKDGGSGLYNGAADEMLAEFEQRGMTEQLERVAKIAYTMLRRDLDLRLKAGLISKQEHDSYTSMYDFYVPLRGAAEREDGGQIGKLGRGFDIRGKEVRNAFGRLSLSENPVAQIIQMRQEGIVRAEKNRATRALMGMVQKYPNAEVWEMVGKLPTRETLDPETGTVKKIPDMGALREDEVIGVKISGETQYMRIKDPHLAGNIKNLQQLPAQHPIAAAVMALGRVSRYVARTATSGNPNFVLPNAMADIGEGLWSTYSVPKKKRARMVAQYLPNYAMALKAGIANEFKDSGIGRMMTGSHRKHLKRLLGEQVSDDQVSKFEKYRREWEEDGGRINFLAFRDLDEITGEINQQIEKTRGNGWTKVFHPWEVANDFLKVVEKINQPIEVAGRLGGYVTARENGMSREQAAAFALDVVGNYYRRGEVTKFASAYSVFFNPAVQGIEKSIRFFSMPRNLAVLGALPATAAALAAYAISFGADDDDPEGRPLFMDVPEYERNRSIIIPRGVVSETVTIDGKEVTRKRLDYWSWRIPHNLRPLWTFGTEMAILAAGVGGPGESAMNVTRSLEMNTNPLGSQYAWNMLAPTVADPFVDMSANRNFFGGPITPERWPNDEGLPNSRMFWERGQSPAAVWMAQVLNDATGGSRVEPGLVDPYPGQIEYLARFMAGGLGRFALDTADVTADMRAGADLKPNDIPLLNRLRNQTSYYPENDRYYVFREEAKSVKNRIRAARQIATNEEESPEVRAENEAVMLRLMEQYNVGYDQDQGQFNWKDSATKIFDDADDQLSGLRDELTKVANNDNLERAEQKRRTDALRMQIEDVQIEARRQYMNQVSYLAVDGDTFKRRGDRYRVFGIDAPEMSEGEPGMVAKNTLARIITSGENLLCEKKGSSYDRSVVRCDIKGGRWRGKDLSCATISEGAATDWPRYSGGSYADCE